jgi:hypothetical protein
MLAFDGERRSLRTRLCDWAWWMNKNVNLIHSKPDLGVDVFETVTSELHWSLS